MTIEKLKKIIEMIKNSTQERFNQLLVGEEEVIISSRNANPIPFKRNQDLSDQEWFEEKSREIAQYPCYEQFNENIILYYLNYLHFYGAFVRIPGKESIFWITDF